MPNCPSLDFPEIARQVREVNRRGPPSPVWSSLEPSQLGTG